MDCIAYPNLCLLITATGAGREYNWGFPSFVSTIFIVNSADSNK